ncbi:MAG TPA: ABC transporter ATP-binding protein [Oligoflexia bacterium]|nr:ABC transporter ATP-binding protein [Oligoflexia bacterium]HMR24794.1 ABC transporter ATP-binding protein [Oligoflexia bacterium]
MIYFKNVNKAFQTQVVLNNLNLHVKKGEITVIMGPSGVGKSVSLKLLMGLMKPDSGEIILDGQNVCELSDEEMKKIRKKIGMLFQDAALFDYLNVYENVSFPMLEHTKLSEEKIKVHVEEKLSEVGLTDINEKLPSELSGGMRKRVGLARALMLNPKVILFDEPTTGLDPITTSQIGDLILKTQRSRNATVLLINHDLALTYKVADKVAMLYNGEIVEYCTPKELKKSEHPFVKNFLEAHINMENYK